MVMNNPAMRDAAFNRKMAVEAARRFGQEISTRWDGSQIIHAESETPTMSTRQEINKQLEAMRQQLSVLAEMQAKYSILPEEDPFSDGQIVRFGMTIKTRVNNPEYDGVNNTKRLIAGTKDLTFLALRADGNWYITGRSFFNNPVYTWEDMVDTILDCNAELFKFESLDAKGIWETVYSK
jgi:hypothetical protein